MFWEFKESSVSGSDGTTLNVISPQGQFTQDLAGRAWYGVQALFSVEKELLESSEQWVTGSDVLLLLSEVTENCAKYRDDGKIGNLLEEIRLELDLELLDWI